jgi:hypothetical protein
MGTVINPPVGGNTRYPTLAQIASLFRVRIDNTFNADGKLVVGYGGGAGLIMPDANPDLLTIMDSAIGELFSDLRNVGDPSLILDNYILVGLPPIAQPDPALQVALSDLGFWNGTTWLSQWPLPANYTKILALWERQNGVNENFVPMTAAPFGLPGVMQGFRMGVWEVRENVVWMPGCMNPTDIRIRCRITYPPTLYSSGIDFPTTYVPIIDSRNAIVAKMLVLYANRFAPEMYEMLVAEEARLMAKLKLEVVRSMQVFENERVAFGDEAVQDFAISWSWL